MIGLLGSVRVNGVEPGRLYPHQIQIHLKRFVIQSKLNEWLAIIASTHLASHDSH